MCRIVGIVGFEPVCDLERAINSMRDSMTHGGPDDAGTFIDSEFNVVLGNRRLSIIDLSPLGHQPMSNEDKSIWLTYNGEIYNFLEIKKELQCLGYNFRSHSDTEVILKAYEEWGEGSFSKLNGMYAFCIYDQRRGNLYLVRDHAGIKPLYYSVSKNTLIFSSEVKAFRVFENNWEENNDWKIYFLIFGHIPEPFTTLKSVLMLPKGSFLKLDLKTKDVKVEKFVEFTFTEEIRDIGEAIGKVKNEFKNVIQRHLISDAPIGVFMSGGIDSSLIALIAHTYQKENLRTLSVVFNEKGFSEKQYQEVVLSKMKSKHTSYLVTGKDFIDSIDDIFQAMDQPTVDGVNTYFISKCAKEDGLKAVLSGLGGDELFGGYPSFKSIGLLMLLKRFKAGSKRFSNLFGYLGDDRTKKLSFLSIDNALSYYLAVRGLFCAKQTSSVLDIGEGEVYKALEKVYLVNELSLDKGNFVSYLETNLYMQNQLLKDSDFMSMWHSVEVRVPFLDREFLRLVFSIDEDIKFGKKKVKFLLVDSFKEVLPFEIVYRDKMGFTFPFEQWMRNNISTFCDMITEKNGAVDEIIQDFIKGRLNWPRFWGLIVLNQHSL